MGAGPVLIVLVDQESPAVRPHEDPVAFKAGGGFAELGAGVLEVAGDAVEVEAEWLGVGLPVFRLSGRVAKLAGDLDK